MQFHRHRFDPRRTLLDALEEPGTCFILGAGASACLVPFGAELGLRVRKRILEVGIFPANLVLRDAIAERILGSPPEFFATLEDELAARHFLPAAVHAATIAALRPEPPLAAPPQYRVFWISKHRLSILNFNNDGLADHYCGNQHTVIDIHGTSLSNDVRAHIGWENHINALQRFPDLRGLEIQSLLLPQREPESIAETPRYIAAQRLLTGARRVILVGYSFGGMDDVVAYEKLMAAIKSQRMAAVVVDPNGEDLAIRISEDSHSVAVGSLPVCWDKLASAILASLSWQGYKTCNHRRLCYRCVEYLYGAFLDGSSCIKQF